MSANPTDTPRTGRPASELGAIQVAIDEHGHGRVPRALRTRQVLALAEQLFVERGYTGASMDELAKRAGVSKPVVYDMVGSKEDLYAACMAKAADELSLSVATEVLHAGNDDASRLRAGALAWFRFIEERRALWHALLAPGEAPANDAVDAIRARQDGFVAMQLTETAAAEGRSIDPELVGAVATAMNGAFEAMGRWWDRHPDHSAEQLADLYTAVVLPGLASLLDWAPER